MDRRTALKNVAFITGGVTLLARCGFGDERLPIALKNLNVTIGQEDLLKEIVATIIPETDTPGAAALEVHNFVWVMADDCMKKEDQDRFMRGISGFNKLLKHDRDVSFEEVKPENRQETLEYISSLETYTDPVDSEGNPEYEAEAVRFFLSVVKNITIQGFMQSEYIMTEVMPYKLVPGPMPGCIDNEPGKKINIYG